MLKFEDIFKTSFVQEHAPVSSFIYGGRFMNRQWAIPEKIETGGGGGGGGGVEYMEFSVVLKTKWNFQG